MGVLGYRNATRREFRPSVAFSTQFDLCRSRDESGFWQLTDSCRNCSVFCGRKSGEHGAAEPTSRTRLGTGESWFTSECGSALGSQRWLLGLPWSRWAGT